MNNDKPKIPKIGDLYFEKDEQFETNKSIFVYVGRYQPQHGSAILYRFLPICGSKWLVCNTTFQSRFELLE